MTALVALPPLEHDPERLRELLERTLQRPGFEEAEPGWVSRLGDEVMRWLVGIVGRVIDALSAAAGGGWPIVVVGVAVLALVLWRTLRVASRDQRVDHAPATVDGRGADEWRREAAAHQAAGRLAEAVLARYRAAIAGLVARGIIEDVPGRTVRELDAEVAAAAPALSAPLEAAGAAVDRVWYAHRPATDADLAAVAAADDAVRQRSGRRAPAEVGA